MQPPQVSLFDTSCVLTCFPDAAIASNGRVTAHGEVHLYSSHGCPNPVVVRKAFRDSRKFNIESAVLGEVYTHWYYDMMVCPILQPFANAVPQLGKLMQSSASFHYPTIVQATPIPPTTESDVLYMSWDGVYLSRHLQSRPDLLPTDYLTLILQLHWALMVAGELGGIRHTDCHMGNVVVRQAPPGTRWRMRMAMHLLATSPLAKAIRNKYNSDIGLVIEFDTPFFVTIIDWASIASADVYTPLPPSIPLAIGYPKVSRTSSRSRSSSGSNNNGSVRLASHYVPGLPVTELIIAVTAIVGSKSLDIDIGKHTLMTLCSRAQMQGASGWVELATKLAKHPKCNVNITGSASMEAVFGTPMYSLRNFEARESIELIVEQVRLDLPSSPPLRKRGRPRIYPTAAARSKAYRDRKRKNRDGSPDHPPALGETAETGALVLDICGNIYDTTLVVVNWSIVSPGKLGVFVKVAVAKGTKLTDVAPVGWACPAPLRPVSRVIQLLVQESNATKIQEGNATIKEGKVVALVDLPANTEVVLSTTS